MRIAVLGPVNSRRTLPGSASLAMFARIENDSADNEDRSSTAPGSTPRMSGSGAPPSALTSVKPAMDGASGSKPPVVAAVRKAEQTLSAKWKAWSLMKFPA